MHLRIRYIEWVGNLFNLRLLIGQQLPGALQSAVDQRARLLVDQLRSGLTVLSSASVVLVVALLATVV